MRISVWRLWSKYPENVRDAAGNQKLHIPKKIVLSRANIARISNIHKFFNKRDFTLRMDYGANLTSTDDWDNDLQLNARPAENILYILYRLPLVQTLEMYEQVISIALWARHFQGLHLPFGYLNILHIRTVEIFEFELQLYETSYRNISW